MTSSSRARRLKRWAMAACLAASFSISLPAVSRADDDAVPDHDARLDGYPTKMVLDANGTAVTYILTVLLGALCIGAMFISGKRTHLD